MAKGCFTKAKIAGIVTCVPENSKNIDDELETLYDGNQKQLERIKKTVGLSVRHVVKGDTTTSDLCEMAANRLLDGMNIDRNSIDTLIFLSQTPDFFQPSTAAYLQGVLGLPQTCAVFDVNQGCSGYIYALWLAFMMIQTNSCENVLVLVGETLSKTVNKNDSNVAPIFGDAGTATLVSKGEESSYFSLHADGKKFDAIMQLGAFRKPSKDVINEKILSTSSKRELGDLYMDGAEVFNFSITKEPEAIREMLEISNSTAEDIDYFVFHQANNHIVKNIARRAKLPIEKIPLGTIGRYGNQSSASIPGAICDMLKDEVSSKRLELVISGFGAGLSWATCKLTLDNIYCLDIIHYKED